MNQRDRRGTLSRAALDQAILNVAIRRIAEERVIARVFNAAMARAVAPAARRPAAKSTNGRRPQGDVVRRVDLAASGAARRARMLAFSAGLPGGLSTDPAVIRRATMDAVGRRMHVGRIVGRLR